MKLYPLQTSSESEDFEQDTGTEDFFDNLFHNIYQESLNLLKHNIIKRDLQKLVREHEIKNQDIQRHRDVCG